MIDAATVVAVITDEHRRNDMLRATGWTNEAGYLTLRDAASKVVAVFAPGAWLSVFYAHPMTPKPPTPVAR